MTNSLNTTIPPNADLGELPEFLLVTGMIRTREELQCGDMVAFTLSNGTSGSVIFGIWYGPTGRDAYGRFIRAGSFDETLQVDSMIVTKADLAMGRVQILGRLDVVGRLQEEIQNRPAVAFH